jgi:hypothetical protein
MANPRTYLADNLAAIARPRPERQYIGTRRGDEPADWSKDTGCPGISKSCLQCPLPVCRFDLPKEESHQMIARYLAWRQQQAKG